MVSEDLFPRFPQNKCFISDFDLNRRTSVFTESPFLMNADNLEDAFYPSANTLTTGSTKIISENNVSPQLVLDMTAFWDGNSDNKLGTNERTLFTYKIKIFISRDASYLKQAFDKYTADASDVCFFLEDNSTDIFSDRTAYIKTGKLFQTNLKDRSTIAMIETKSDFFGRYKSYTNNGETYTLNFSETEITELINTGKISNPAMSVVIGLYQLLNLQNIILAPVYSILSQGLLWITATARKYIEFEDKNWDPQAVESGSTFVPFFFTLVIGVKDAGAETIKAVIEAIKKGIDAKEATLKANLSTILNPTTKDYESPDSMSEFVKKCLDYISQFKNLLYNGIDAVVNTFIFLGDKWLNAINAFYCGLWNSVVEMFLGLIDIVGYVFWALTKVGEAVADAQNLIPQMLEVLDEFVQMMLQTDIMDTIVSVINKLTEKVLSINLYSLTNEVSIERVAYFVGNIAGFIVELIIDAFISGGTKGVVDLFKKFGAAGKNILETVMAKATKLFGAAGNLSFETISKCIQFFIDLLKKGKEEVLKWIDDFFALLEDAAKLGKEIIQKIKEIFEFTSEQIDQLKKTGLDFVTYTDEAGKVDCGLCRIATN
ncbi:MAG: hypothetical protein IM600_03855 [Bacteroidetes bacterium]|nr:hypothetical protein [Bacteroidota bacterium]MCA6442544.1 hypothetical protein [Bacteroidota bacterium]